MDYRDANITAQIERAEKEAAMLLAAEVAVVVPGADVAPDCGELPPAEGELSPDEGEPSPVEVVGFNDPAEQAGLNGQAALDK